MFYTINSDSVSEEELGIFHDFISSFENGDLKSFLFSMHEILSQGDLLIIESTPPGL